MISREETWESEAACAPVADFLPEMANAWIHEESYGAPRAKRICETECKVREWCVRAAVADPEAEGLRGGFYFEEGAVYREEATQIKKLYNIKAKVRRRFTKRDALLTQWQQKQRAESEDLSEDDYDKEDAVENLQGVWDEDPMD